MMTTSSFLKPTSVILTFCLTFSTLPKTVLAWDGEAYDDAYEESRENIQEETDEGRDEFLETAGIVLGGILVVSLIAALIHHSFDSKTSDTEQHVKDVRYDLNQDVSLAFDVESVGHGADQQSSEQATIDSFQPTLTLSMRF